MDFGKFTVYAPLAPLKTEGGSTLLKDALNKDPNPCLALKCSGLAYPVNVCRRQGRGHRWQREAIEDRQRIEGQAARESSKKAAYTVRFGPKAGQNRGDLRGHK